MALIYASLNGFKRGFEEFVLVVQQAHRLHAIQEKE